jgi:molecular chaperone DnaK
VTDWVLSIDFGTSFTSAAIRDDGRPVLVRMPSPEGPRDVMPSAVFLPAGRELVVGWMAENQAVLAPDRFEPTPKRRLGIDEHLLLGGEPVPVATAVAAVLERVFDEARRSRGETAPRHVSLTHPASWARGRVDALVDAARRSGIETPRLLSEPEGAALHFATARVDVGGLVAVYDLGGGTFDVAVLERVGEASFRVAGKPGGRDGLGGEEFDRKLYEHVAKQLAFESPEHWASIRERPRSHRDFRIEVRRAKEALSYAATHDVYLPEVQDRSSWRVTREEFEELIRPDLDASIEILGSTLAEAGIDDPADPSQLAELYLAGGSTRIPLVAQAIGERFGRVPRSLDEPKSVVALGATSVERAGAYRSAPPPVSPTPSVHTSPTPPTTAPADAPAAPAAPAAPSEVPVAPVEAPPAPIEASVAGMEAPAVPAATAEAPSPAEPALAPANRLSATDPVVLALVGAALALFGTAVASARGVSRIVLSPQWSALEAVAVPVAVLVVVVALRTARGGGLREVGLLLGLGVQMTLGAAGWFVLLVRTNDGSPRFQDRSPILAVPTLIGALLVLAAAVLAWRRMPRTSASQVKPMSRVRRIAALTALIGAALTLAAVALWPWDYDPTHGERVSVFTIDSWFVVEPLGSAALAAVFAGVVAATARRTAVAGGVLLAIGVQNILYFVPYVGDYLANLHLPSGPAGGIGVVGALLTTGSGIWLCRIGDVGTSDRREAYRWPVRLIAAGAAGVLAGFAVSSSRSWTALMRPDGIGVPEWSGTTWHFLEAIAVPVLVAGALIALVRVPGRRPFAAGLLLGFGAQTLVAAIASLVYAHEQDASRIGILAIVVLAAAVLAAASAAAAYVVRRETEREPTEPASPRWIAILGVAGAAGVAGALLLPDLRAQYGDARSFFDVNNWLILEPAVASVLLAVSAIVLLVRPSVRLLAAGVLVAVGVQTLLWFLAPIGVAVSEPFDIVSVGLGSVVGALGAVAALTSGVLSYRAAVSRVDAAPVVAPGTS